MSDLLAKLRPLRKRAIDWIRVSSIQPPDREPERALIKALETGGDIRTSQIRSLSTATEERLANDLTLDRFGIHRDIGRAIFARSSDLYNGHGLPNYLRRYTYPAFISIALTSHCNAACFFCRGSDYKGTSIDFDNLVKLESAIKHARTVDLTGWGEAFFYPRFDQALNYVLSVNPYTPHLIQVTSNGSFLSAKWGKLLSGKINRLVVSINAASSETYEQQMRYKNKRFTFANTIANIQAFQKEITEEDRKRIIFHMVANTDNFHEIPDLTLLAAKLGISTVSCGNYICADSAHRYKTLWNVKKEYNAALKTARALGETLGVGVWGREFFVSEKEVKGSDACLAPFEQFFIEMPGTTTPCCFMGMERMGNVYEDGFEAIWFSDLMTRLRHSRFMAPCKVCTVFSPFDSEIAHISAFLLTKEEEVLTKGGPRLGRKLEGPSAQ
jgi:MoaA/NifB/PqqE/SkfB family radical SAM enzyme